MRNFCQVLSGIDPVPLLRQVEENPQLWNSDPVWRQTKVNTALYAVNNIILRTIGKTPIGQHQRWDRDAFSILSEAQPIVLDVLRAIPGEHLGTVVISRMVPGEVIAPHIDQMPPGIPRYYQRYQIPLSVNPGVTFACGDEELFMEPGNAYWFDNSILHSVTNGSDADRISMRVDIRPFLPSQPDRLPVHG